jgi:arginyl-tRNA synthetase
LRNAILGDTFVRMLRVDGRTWRCRTTSTTPACRWPTWWSGFRIWKRGLPRTSAQALIAALDFDYLCWDVYARGIGVLSGQHRRPEVAQETLHAIEAGDGPRPRWRTCVRRIVAAHLDHVAAEYRYDVLPRESEILHLKFWARRSSC